MLHIEVSRIPPEGLDVHEELRPPDVHVEGETDFALEPGGSLHGHLERGDDDSVHLRGRLSAAIGLECGRCLEPFSFPLEQELDLFFLRHVPDRGEEEEEAADVSDREVVVAYYRDNRLDLGETVREQVYLALPMKRLCRSGCQGLCPSCGSNRNLRRCECVPEPEKRLWPLLLDKGSS